MTRTDNQSYRDELGFENYRFYTIMLIDAGDSPPCVSVGPSHVAAYGEPAAEMTPHSFQRYTRSRTKILKNAVPKATV